MSKYRILRFNELLKKQLGKILLEEFEFPEKTFVTVTDVSTSPDLQHALVCISIIPEEKGKEILRILSKTVYGIQQKLNKTIPMRPIPKIEWMIQANASRVQRVEELLEEIKNKK